YAGIDVQGKAVLVIRRKPQQGVDDGPFEGKRTTHFATFQHKATNAFQHGAVAVLLVNDLASLGSEKDQLLAFGAGGFDVNSNIPFVMLSREFSDKLLDLAGERTLAQLEADIDKDLKPRSRELKGWAVTEQIVIERSTI